MGASRLGTRRGWLWNSTAAVAAIVMAVPAGSYAVSSATTRVSLGWDGTEGDGPSRAPAVSADGRFVAFASGAGNLVAGDANRLEDVFVHDRDSGQTTRVSVASDGTEGDGPSRTPAVSADGRFVAFDSDAGNLVVGDGNDTADVFVHDRHTGQTSRVSVASDGTEGDGPSWATAVSADGRFAAFSSSAANLVSGDGNHAADVFVHDRDTGQTSRVSVASDGREPDGPSGDPSLAADGSLVAFTSEASNLAAGDHNATDDVFVHERDTGRTTRVSSGPDGEDGDGPSFGPVLSDDGRLVAFGSMASNLVAGDTNLGSDVFIFDREDGTTTRVSVTDEGEGADASSSRPSFSRNGRLVAFASEASNLVTGDTNGLADAFLHDRIAGTTVLLSAAPDGTPADGASYAPAVGANGTVVAFTSEAKNLVEADTNRVIDVFVHTGP